MIASVDCCRVFARNTFTYCSHMLSISSISSCTSRSNYGVIWVWSTQFSGSLVYVRLSELSF